MRKYKIIWSDLAIYKLKKLPKPVANTIFKKTEQLREDPHLKNIKKLRKLPFFRLRVGDYRVIFDIQNKIFRILVVNIGHRKKIYKEFKRF